MSKADEIHLKQFVALRDYMHQLSAKLFRAYWQDGLEFYLFRCVRGLETSRLEPHELGKLSRLSRELGGWIVWDEEANAASFMPDADWLKLYVEEFGDYGSDE
jgi:hypothetical protein